MVITNDLVMKRICFIFLFIGVIFNVLGQSKIDSIKLYKFFKPHGYTTMAAYNKFIDLDLSKIELITLSNVEVDSINSILNKSKIKKHIQQKYGTRNVFFIFYVNGKKQKALYAFDACIVNFTEKKDFVIKNPSNIDYIHQLVKKYNTVDIEFNNE